MCGWSRALLVAGLLAGAGACHKKDDTARAAPAPTAAAGSPTATTTPTAATPGAKDPLAGPAPAATGDAGKPTAADCDVAVANLKKVLGPEAVSGDADDHADCMKYPRTIVLCLETAKTEAEAEGCVARAGGKDEPEAIPPEERASEDECKKAVAKVRELTPGIEESEAAMIADCKKSATKSEAACLAAAKATKDLEKCEPDE